MATNYEIILTDDYGNPIANISTFVQLTATKVVNGMGTLQVELPPSFNQDLIAKDRMIQVWRQPAGGVLILWDVYFVLAWEFNTRGADEFTIIEGRNPNHLLFRRIVAAYANSSQASKTDFADDMMKETVTQSIADGVAPTPDAGTRVWGDLSIAGDTSSGPTITKEFAFKKLLTINNQGILPALAKAAKEEGTEVFFAVEPNVISANSINFIFNTYINQPGQDVSDSVTFSLENGNLRNPSLRTDYINEENYIYAGGQGQEADRNVQQVYDSDRYVLSQWARSEGFADARNQPEDNGVIAAGNDKLNDGRPIIRFTGQPLDTAGTRFGIDWDFGYLVRTKYKNIEFNSVIRATTISVNDNGEETIGARLDFEATI